MMWHGLVDAYFPVERLCIQFDGRQHLDGQRMHACDEQVDRGAAFNKAAWHAGERVIRMHYMDGGPNGQHMVPPVCVCSTHPC